MKSLGFGGTFEGNEGCKSKDCRMKGIRTMREYVGKRSTQMIEYG